VVTGDQPVGDEALDDPFGACTIVGPPGDAGHVA
jgi:hypothetical protein